jgi:hypothetical protein
VGLIARKVDGVSDDKWSKYFWFFPKGPLSLSCNYGYIMAHGENPTDESDVSARHPLHRPYP